jgi:phosphoribosylanthranilate isomerase
MSITKVKICGITNYEDAMAAVEMGADILGFNFYPPARATSPAKAIEIIRKLPGLRGHRGVFVNAAARRSAISPPGPFQLDPVARRRNPSSASWCTTAGRRSRPSGSRTRDIGAGRPSSYFTSALLLDAYNPTLYGGTGHVRLVADQALPKRIFLAGGITPDNAPRPSSMGVYGIDICSGIESAPGKKDHEKMKQLFEHLTISDGTGLKAYNET